MNTTYPPVQRAADMCGREDDRGWVCVRPNLHSGSCDPVDILHYPISHPENALTCR